MLCPEHGEPDSGSCHLNSTGKQGPSRKGFPRDRGVPETLTPLLRMWPDWNQVPQRSEAAMAGTLRQGSAGREVSLKGS